MEIMSKLFKEGKRGDWELEIFEIEDGYKNLDGSYHKDLMDLTYKVKTIFISIKDIFYSSISNKVDAVGLINFRIDTSDEIDKAIEKEFQDAEKNSKLIVKISNDISFEIHKTSEKRGSMNVLYKNKALFENLYIGYTKSVFGTKFRFMSSGKGVYVNEDVLSNILRMFKR